MVCFALSWDGLSDWLAPVLLSSQIAQWAKLSILEPTKSLRHSQNSRLIIFKLWSLSTLNPLYKDFTATNELSFLPQIWVHYFGQDPRRHFPWPYLPTVQNVVVAQLKKIWNICNIRTQVHFPQIHRWWNSQTFHPLTLKIKNFCKLIYKKICFCSTFTGCFRFLAKMKKKHR